LKTDLKGSVGDLCYIIEGDWSA